MGLFTFLIGAITMGKKHGRKHLNLHIGSLTFALQGAAVTAAGALSHRLPPPGDRLWTSAKRKYGHHAKKAFCSQCGAMALVMPLGNVQAPGSHEAHHQPGAKGDALFEQCLTHNQPPPSTALTPSQLMLMQ